MCLNLGIGDWLDDNPGTSATLALFMTATPAFTSTYSTCDQTQQMLLCLSTVALLNPRLSFPFMFGSGKWPAPLPLQPFIDAW